jgi:hypothetical protein
MTNSYSSEDVQQILQRALARRQQGDFSQAQLAEMAAELGVSPQELQQAQQEWLAQRDEVHQYRTALTRRRRGFKAHLIPYIAVNTFLVLLNLVTSPYHFWAIYPILGWGLGLALHGAGVYLMDGK